MTPDEAAFLKAIADNPADETSRLVYADWLSDHDDPLVAFTRLSADFLRRVRGLADMRQTLPAEWLEVMDPLFNRFCVYRLPSLGEGIAGGTVTALCVTPGNMLTLGQPLFEIETEKASMELGAECAGTVISVLVRLGERIVIGQPMFTYLAQQESISPLRAPVPVLPPPPLPTVMPQVPREPLAGFIENLELNRDSLRTVPVERIETVLSSLMLAAEMVFGRSAIGPAWAEATERRGWPLISTGYLVDQMRSRGYTDQQMIQERLDLRIEMLRVLLETHGQPSELRELPTSSPPATE